MAKISVSVYARKHGVSRMTVLRRIHTGELEAVKRVVEPARFGRPARYAWFIEADAKIVKYQAGRPPNMLEIEQVIVDAGQAVRKRRARKPAKPSAFAGKAKVISLFARRGGG